MSKSTESNLNEMMAGDGSALSMPPAFVFVNKEDGIYKISSDKNLIQTSTMADMIDYQFETKIRNIYLPLTSILFAGSACFLC